MRCRMRYRTGWTAFLFVFTLAGVILTYRQLGDHEKKETKNQGRYDGYDPNNDLLKHFDQDQFRIAVPVQHSRQKFNDGDDNDEEDDDDDDDDASNMQHGRFGMRFPNRKLPREPVDIMKVPMKQDHQLSEPIASQVLGLLRELYPSNWGFAMNADEMALHVKEILLDIGIDSKLSCKEIDQLRVAASVKIGHKKYVDRAFVDNHGAEIIIKSQGVDQDIKIKCMHGKYDYDKCHNMGNYMLLREIILMSVLKHPSIINLRGYCIRGESININLRKKGIVIATEPGSVVSAVTLSLYSWKAKLLYAIQLADLLKYLQNSPIGSVALVGVRSEDFVLVDEWIKLVDLDDVLYEEKQCTTAQDCAIDNASTYEGLCKSGRCEGRNAAYNINQINVLMDQLLKNPPPGDKSNVMKLKQRLATIAINATDLLLRLNELKKSADESGSARWIPDQQKQSDYVLRSKKRRDQEMRRNQMIVQPDLDTMHYGAEHDYVRVAEANFPGMHDYTCPVSRVAWGCVFTVRSLKQAKSTCDADVMCKAFVLFTSNPDTATLMTMVAKKSGSSRPERNAGATLFIKSSEIKKAPKIEVKEETTSPKTVIIRESPLECYNRLKVVTSEARVSREKRLMAHLGLKGFSDLEWRSKINTQRIVTAKLSPFFKVASNKGGRFNVDLKGLQKEKQFLKGTLVSEEGPSQYHVAHMITYKLDRTLGLYHTPPTGTWSLTPAQLSAIAGDENWRKFVDLNISEEKTVDGLMTVQVPRVIKEESLYLNRLASMTGDITHFSRLEKMQLEYILLWYLTKTLHSGHEHLGYKGHLIQFDGDKAFQDTSIDLIGYFFHCQFPNVVYKAMSCFKCHGKPGSSSVCSLGQEILQQVVESGFERSTIIINHMNDEELASVINKAASSVLRQVDVCIKAFGREEVLY